MLENYFTENGEECWKIFNWTAPWVDNGKRMSEFIDSIQHAASQETDDDDYNAIWKIGSLLLSRQLERDIELARISKEMGL